ncbi:MAG: hypothetical protein ABIZ04_20610 [Opitutus sp.]
MFAVLHVSDFPLQAVLRLQRDLAAQPVALMDETRRPPLVMACTEAARLAGVASGQTGPQAMARCATIILRTAQPEAEAEARAGLIAAAWSVSPQVEDTAPGVCTIQVGGVSPKAREGALRQAIAQLNQLGLSATAGLAATPLLALYAAQSIATAATAVTSGSDSDVGSVLARAPSSGASASGLPTKKQDEAAEESLFDVDGAASRVQEDENAVTSRSDVGSVLARAPNPGASASGLPTKKQDEAAEESLFDVNGAASRVQEDENAATSGSDVGSVLARAPKSGASASGLPTKNPREPGQESLFPVSESVGAAVSAVHEDRSHYGAHRSSSPKASTRRTPKRSGVFVVDDRCEFLRDLPLAVAEPPAHVAEILSGWGVQTLGELTALTKADVTQRLGTDGLLLWERAAGEVTRPLRLITPAQTFTAEITLEHEIETLEPLLFVLRRFIDRLALELKNAGFVAGELTLGLMLEDDTVYTRAFRLPEPTAQEQILFRVLHTHLESLHTAATVRGAKLECRPVRPLARQQGLFESALRDPHGFAETLARVSAVVGPEHVGTPELENTHRPDAVKLVMPASVVPAAAKDAVHPPRGLPLRRYRSPLIATVELSGASPAFVWTTAMHGAVRALAGPWRGSGDWWDAGRAWRRAEWDAELDNGGVYRLLRTPEGWFVEGEYD